MRGRHLTMVQCKPIWIYLVAMPLINSQLVNRQDGNMICQEPRINTNILTISDICDFQTNISQKCELYTYTTECENETARSHEILTTVICDKNAPLDLKIECSAGNELILNETGFECHANEQSIADDIHCYTRDCGYFGEIENGVSSLELMPINGNTYQTKIRVTCNHGYVLQGWPLIECDEHLRWNEQKPTCNKVKCGSLPGLNSSCVQEIEVRPLEHGETNVILICQPEHEKISVTQSEQPDAYCTISGEWSNNVSCFCDCLVPKGIIPYDTSNLVHGNFLKHREVLDWVCPENYEKKYNRTFQCMDGKLVFLEYFSTKESRLLFETLQKNDLLECRLIQNSDNNNYDLGNKNSNLVITILLVLVLAFLGWMFYLCVSRSRQTVN